MKLISIIIISVLLGGVLGYGMSSISTTAQIQQLENQLENTISAVQVDVGRLESRTDDLEDQLPLDWKASDIDNLNMTLTNIKNIVDNMTEANVREELTYVYRDLGWGGDGHDIDGLVWNSGHNVANNTRINLTFLLGGTDYVYETIELGAIEGFSIRIISETLNFDTLNRVPEFSYNITWDNS
jgi:type II secretory pathway pseudopilin PulG